MSLTATDWLALLTHFLSLSLLAVGGAITTAPDMHRFVVNQHGWLTDAQFSASIALAQAAPGQAGFLGGVTATAGTDSNSIAFGIRHRF